MNLDEFDTLDDNKVKKKRVKNKKAADRFGLTAFLTMVIGLLAGALIMMLIVYYTSPNLKGSEKVSNIITLGEKENKQSNDAGAKDTESEEDSEGDFEDVVEENDNLDEGNNPDGLEILKEALSNGDSTSKALRKAFKNELVCARDGRYFFAPLNQHINYNNYAIENLTVADDGRYEYYFDDGSKAKTGIDVSKYQGEIDWEKVKNDGIDFAIIRAGIRGYESGKLVMDEGFAQNITSAIDAGLEVGVYFFSQAVTTEEAVEEADAVIEAMNNNPLNYPLVYDLEHVKGGRRDGIDVSLSTDIARAFCERAAECGYESMIYGNLDTFLLQLELSRVEDIKKWFAFYETEFYYPYEYSIWQYSDSGIVDGIVGEVDLNLDLRH